MSFELQLKERINQYFEEFPDVVPDMFEFISWLYDILFWEEAEKMDEKQFRSTKEIMKKYLPQTVEQRKLKMETPKETGERIVDKILGKVV